MASLPSISAHPASAAVTEAPAQGDTITALRGRMEQMAGALRVPLAMPDELAGLIRLRTGGSYRVDDTSLLLALLSAASRNGTWTAVVGVGDLGIQAAAEAGLDLDRTIVVPDPGDLWLEAVAALIDVTPAIWLRPTSVVRPALAAKLAGRLRKRNATLLVQGEWSGCEARLSCEESRWWGAEAGHGRLRSRQVCVVCRRAGAPDRSVRLWLPAVDAPIRVAEELLTLPEARETG